MGKDGMTDSPGIFIEDANRLRLLTDRGRAYCGLARSNAPDLNERVRWFFDRLDERLGFRDGPEGRAQQEAFNELIRYAYPEIMIDLADLLYVQHERPMVFLNLDQLHINREADADALDMDPRLLNTRMEAVFHALAGAIRTDRTLFDDPDLIRLLAESYSFYLWLTKNFPWEDPLPQGIGPGDGPVLDVATGLAGFSLIHDWPDTHPPLILSDTLPFIIKGLNHFRQLMGKTHVEIRRWEFPLREPMENAFGSIHVSKLLHHLQRDARQAFLAWVERALKPGGQLIIVDTDLEYQILKDAGDPVYRQKLMPGYLETLVRIEDKFCHHMLEDVRAAGFTVGHFDSHEYYDETDAYSHFPGDNLPLKFMGMELVATK